MRTSIFISSLSAALVCCNSEEKCLGQRECFYLDSLASAGLRVRRMSVAEKGKLLADALGINVAPPPTVDNCMMEFLWMMPKMSTERTATATAKCLRYFVHRFIAVDSMAKYPAYGFECQWSNGRKFRDKWILDTQEQYQFQQQYPPVGVAWPSALRIFFKGIPLQVRCVSFELNADKILASILLDSAIVAQPAMLYDKCRNWHAFIEHGILGTSEPFLKEIVYSFQTPVDSNFCYRVVLPCSPYFMRGKKILSIAGIAKNP